jgi:hypothetical protein
LALGRGDESLFSLRSALLKPHHERIGDRQFIDAAAADRTIAEVGRNAS